LIFNRLAKKANDGISAFFLLFWCLNYAYSIIVWGEIMFDFDKIRIFKNATSSFFQVR